MKSRHRLPSITPILIGFSILLIGVAEITALWALTKVILPTSISSPSNDNYPLGGEGLTLEYPMTRQQFNREFLAE